MREIRGREIRALGEVVPAAQTHGGLGGGLGGEAGDFGRRHGAALELQALHRGGRELAEIARAR